MRVPVLALTCALLPAAFPAAAQSESAEDLRGIRLALERLVALQEADRRQTEIEILFKRIELHERRIEPLQNKLNAAEREIDDLEQNRRSLERMLEQHEERLREEIKDGVDVPRSETRMMLEDIERTLSTQGERLEERTLRARMLETDLAAASRAIERLDARLADRLDEDE